MFVWTWMVKWMCIPTNGWLFYRIIQVLNSDTVVWGVQENIAASFIQCSDLVFEISGCVMNHKSLCTPNIKGQRRQ